MKKKLTPTTTQASSPHSHFLIWVSKLKSAESWVVLDLIKSIEWSQMFESWYRRVSGLLKLALAGLQNLLLYALPTLSPATLKELVTPRRC